jgi:riboflavin synthase alpha subunit
LSSKTRLADTIAKFNSNLSKLASIEVNGVSLTADEIEKLKIPAPLNVTTESFASAQLRPQWFGS